MQERLTATIPSLSEWHNENIEEKGKTLGMSRTEFIVNAVDFMYNFDTETYIKLKQKAKALRVPLYIFIQNSMIKQMAQFDATNAIFGAPYDSENFDNMLFVTDKKGERLLTGEELYKWLYSKYLKAEIGIKINLLSKRIRDGVQLSSEDQKFFDKYKNLSEKEFKDIISGKKRFYDPES